MHDWKITDDWIEMKIPTKVRLIGKAIETCHVLFTYQTSFNAYLDGMILKKKYVN